MVVWGCCLGRLIEVAGGQGHRRKKNGRANPSCQNTRTVTLHDDNSIKHASQPFSTAHLSFRRADALCCLDKLPVNALVIPFSVIVFKKLVDCVLEVAFAEEDHPVGDLPFK